MDFEEHQLMSIVIQRELDKAYDEVAKWFKTVASLTSEDPEYTAAVEELEKAVEDLKFWNETDKNHYCLPS